MVRWRRRPACRILGNIPFLALLRSAPMARVVSLHRSLLGVALACACGAAMAQTPAADVDAARDMLKHAVAFRTELGQVPDFARYLAGRLEAAGFDARDIEIIPVGNTAAMTVRYRGRGKAKPILLSGHMDAVTARPEDWQRDPFTLVEENGYLYGRGVADMKTAVVVLVQTFIRFKREGFVPNGDLILVLSGDEETEMASTRELAKRYHDARFLLNADAGGGTLDDSGKPVLYELQTAEKTYADFRITFTSPGGHSSEPDVPGNAIYRLAKAIDRIAAYQFPDKISPTTRASLKALGQRMPGELGRALLRYADHPDDAAAAATIAAAPEHVGQIRTTCVATMLQGGHALNALPQRAAVDVNCRIFPDTPVAAVRDTLAKVIDDPGAQIEVLPPPPVDSPESPLRKDVLAAVADAVHARFPGVEVVPGMSAGASDSMHFRNAGVDCYGVDGAFVKDNDTFAHGLNEKLPASEVPAELDYWHRLLTTLSK
jgi:acetylornithine deacetylase/succinyl-diaminopimelate desuccinylase-like protein